MIKDAFSEKHTRFYESVIREEGLESKIRKARKRFILCITSIFFYLAIGWFLGLGSLGLLLMIPVIIALGIYFGEMEPITWKRRLRPEMLHLFQLGKACSNWINRFPSLFGPEAYTIPNNDGNRILVFDRWVLCFSVSEHFSASYYNDHIPKPIIAFLRRDDEISNPSPELSAKIQEEVRMLQMGWEKTDSLILANYATYPQVLSLLEKVKETVRPPMADPALRKALMDSVNKA